MGGVDTTNTTRAEELLLNLAHVRARLAKARELAGRENEKITILPISKYHTAEDIKLLADLGVKDFGENIHQAAKSKIEELPTIPGLAFDPVQLNWHMVGQIQSNKARGISKWASHVHSLDRLNIAKVLATAAEEFLGNNIRQHPLKIYLQLSLDGDPFRGGAQTEDIFFLAEYVISSPSLKLEGLMLVPPLHEDLERSYANAAEFRQKFLQEFPQAKGFSAGMSQDMEIAINYGSTCVRVGTAIFGPRR